MSVPRTSKSMALSFTWRTQHLCCWSSGTFSNGEDPNVCSHRRRPLWGVRCTLNCCVPKLSQAKIKRFHSMEVPVGTILQRYIWVPFYVNTCRHHPTEVPVGTIQWRYLWVPSYRGTCRYHHREVPVDTILQRNLSDSQFKQIYSCYKLPLKEL